jgi:hypothetical protein
VPDFVEVVLVQLSDEAREVAVFEVLGEYVLGEFLILRIGQRPVHGWCEFAMDVLRGRQSYRHRFPSGPRSRRSDFPASCPKVSLLLVGSVRRIDVLVQLAHLNSISSLFTLADEPWMRTYKVAGIAASGSAGGVSVHCAFGRRLIGFESPPARS